MNTNAENQGSGENPTHDENSIKSNPNPGPPQPGYERITDILGRPIVDVYNPDLAETTWHTQNPNNQILKQIAESSLIDYYLPPDICYAVTTYDIWDHYKTLQKQKKLPTPANPEDIYLASSNLLDKPGEHPAVLVETNVYNIENLRGGRHTPMWKNYHLYEIGPDDIEQYQEDHNTELYRYIYEEAHEQLTRLSLVDIGHLITDDELPYIIPEPAIKAIDEADQPPAGETKLWNMKGLLLDASVFKPQPPQPPLAEAYLNVPHLQPYLQPLLRDQEAEQRENVTRRRFNQHFNQQFDFATGCYPGENITKALQQRLKEAFRGAPTIHQTIEQYVNNRRNIHRNPR